MGNASRGFALLFFFFLASGITLGHGGTTRGPDGSRVPRFGGASCHPDRHEVLAGTTNGSTRGGVTRTTRAALDPAHGWEWWWEHECDAWLHARASAFRALSAPLGATPGLGPDPRRRMILTRDHVGFGALGFLRQGVTDPWFDTRAASAIALGKVLDPSMPEARDGRRALIGLLADPAREVRESACLALGLLGDPADVRDLVLILADDPSVRGYASASKHERIPVRERAFAALALGFLGAQRGLSKSAVSELVDAAKTSAHPDLRVLATLALATARAQTAIPELRKLATTRGDPVVRAHAIVALAKLADTAFAGWLVRDGFTDDSSDVRRSSAIALGLLAPSGDDAAAGVLVRAAQWSTDRPVRSFSLIALGRIGSPKAREFLGQQLKSGNPADRAFAALALGICGGSRPDVQAEVGRALFRAFEGEADDWERGAFAIALGLADHVAAVPALGEALAAAKSWRLRSHLATALALLGARDAEPLVRRLAGDSHDWDAQAHARKALGILGGREPSADLVEAIRNPVLDLSAVGGAAVGLGLGGRTDLVVTVGRVLIARETSRDDARAFAAVALGCLGDKSKAPLLASTRSSLNYLATTDGLREVARIY
jgi:HEAT repeat protein